MEGTHYNLVIYGGNPAGLACAVRAAREGLTVLLVNHTPHIGGLPANGMGLWDTLYEGWRSPIYNEMRQAIFDHYRNTYGKDSPQYAACLPGETGHSNGKYEARVFEQLSEEMIQAESNITLIKSHYPTDIEQADRLITAITFTEMNRDASFRATGDIFVDTSYEGDLLPLANVAFRVGRESKDEFPDNNHMPWEIYVREARRLEGRYMLTEHDVRLAEGIDRAPIHSDTIAICEWYTDVHACHPERVKDSRDEGKVMLHKQTVPGQIPYRSLLANELDNFLVPVCLSSSHLGQSAIRLEPTWMQIAESAGYAAVQAIKNKQTPADIDIDQLQQTLAEQNSMLTFLNDIDLNDDYAHNAAIQWAGTKGFFDTYDARPQDKLDQHTAHRWIDIFVQLCGEKLNTNTLAHLTRGEACQILYDAYFQQP